MLYQGFDSKTAEQGYFYKYPLKEWKIDVFEEITPTAPFTCLHNSQTALLQISIIHSLQYVSTYFSSEFN